MEPLPEDCSAEWCKREINYIRSTSLIYPPFVYSNELSRPGDISSCRTSGINQLGLDFIGYTQAEVDLLGFGFYAMVVHPYDMELQKISLARNREVVFGDGTFDFHLFKPQGGDRYSIFYCPKLIVEVFGDRTMKKILVSAYQLNDMTYAEHELQQAEKEVNRQKYIVKLGGLTAREREVWHLIVNDKSNKEIADQLHISINTVNIHRVNLMQKLGVHSVSALMALAYKSGEF